MTTDNGMTRDTGAECQCREERKQLAKALLWLVDINNNQAGKEQPPRHWLGDALEIAARVVGR